MAIGALASRWPGELTDRLIAKARRGGVCVGTLIHSGHIGRLGEYCEQAAEAGMVSLVMVNTHGGAPRGAGRAARRRGWGPIRWPSAFRTASGPLVLDFGTSATAEGKVRVKKIAGQTCPDGWLLDSDGRPTQRSQHALRRSAGHDSADGRRSGLQGIRPGADDRSAGRRLSRRRDDSREADQSARQLRVHAGHGAGRECAATIILPPRSRQLVDFVRELSAHRRRRRDPTAGRPGTTHARAPHGDAASRWTTATGRR